MALKDIAVNIKATGVEQTVGGFKTVETSVTSMGRNINTATGIIAKSMAQVEGYVKAAVVAFATYKLLKYSEDAALAAARYETLGVVMRVVGNNAGYTGKQMNEFQQGLQTQGIAMVESRQSLTQMASAHMDLTKASELARIAQDAAVIGQMNSSEAFQNMITGIQRGETEIMKTLGLNVDFAGAQERLAAKLGKTTQELTQTEKVQANMNATLSKGRDIAGVYDAAMGTAGKQLSSMQRYMDNLKVTAGSVFNDLLITGVQVFTSGLKAANAEAQDLQVKGQLKGWGENLVIGVAVIADGLMVAYNILKTFVTAGVAGFQQLYDGATAISQAMVMDFSGAKESIQAMALTGEAWVDMTRESFSNVTKFQDAARKMYADRDSEATKAAQKEKEIALERMQMAVGAANAAAALREEADKMLEAKGKELDLENKHLLVMQGLQSAKMSALGISSEEITFRTKINVLALQEKTLSDQIATETKPKIKLQLQEQQKEQLVVNELLRKQNAIEMEIFERKKLEALQQDQFGIIQQQIDLAKKAGLTEEVFERQRILDIQKLQFDYNQKMLDYQDKLNTATQSQADLIRQNIDLYTQMYQAARDEILTRQFTAAEASSGSIGVSSSASAGSSGSSWVGWDSNGNFTSDASSSPSSTTNWSGNAGVYTLGNAQQGATAAQSARASAAAAAQATQATAAATQTAAAAMAQDLTLRKLSLQGLAEEAAVQQLVNTHQNELTKAQQDGLDTTALLSIQQAEYNKLLREQQLAKVTKDTQSFFDTIKSSISSMTSAGNSLVTSLTSAATALRSASAALGPSASMTPIQQYEASRSSLADTMQQASSTGDASLYAKIPALVTSFLDQSKAYNASGSQYTSDFGWAKNLLDGSATAADIAASQAGQVITAAQKQQATLDAIKAALTTDDSAALPKLLTELSSDNGALNRAMQSTTASLGTSGAIATQFKSSFAADSPLVKANTGISASIDTIPPALSVNGTTIAAPFAAAGSLTAALNASFGAGGSTSGAITAGLTGAGGIKEALTGAGGLADWLTQINTNVHPLVNGSGSLGILADYAAATNVALTYPQQPIVSSLSAIQANSKLISTINTTHTTTNTGSTDVTTFRYYAKGGVANDPSGKSIFAENGWEAAVPLPDGRSIPVTLNRADNYPDNSALIAVIRALHAELVALRRQQSQEHAEDVEVMHETSGKVAVAVGGNSAAAVRY
jgi:hypothetical protein